MTRNEANKLKQREFYIDTGERLETPTELVTVRQRLGLKRSKRGLFRA